MSSARDDRSDGSDPDPPDLRPGSQPRFDASRAAGGDHQPPLGQDRPEASRTQPASSRRRRNRRGNDQLPPSSGSTDSPDPGTRSNDPARIQPDARATPAAAGRPVQERTPAGTRRAETVRPVERRTNPAPRPRRTEGTRPPDQGNGRGLSSSPRNPNAFGEIPIRPDNRTFDGLHDRLVCIARSHVIPEDFPVHFRPATASARLGVVVTSGSDLLLCDLSHSGPHVWPDQTVVPDGVEPDPGDRPQQNASIE